MTRAEVATLLAHLAESYPNAPQPDDPHARVAVWHDLLGGYEADAVMAAARHVARQSKRYPEPAKLIEQMSVRNYGELPSETEAWKICTSQIDNWERLGLQALPANLHPVLADCLVITGGVTTLAWCDEPEMRRRIRSAYWESVEHFRSLEAQRAGRPAELPQSDGPRLGGEPRAFGELS